MPVDLHLAHQHHPPIRADYAIGAVGAGFIMRDVQLVAYGNAGFRVSAIASRTPAHAQAAADYAAYRRFTRRSMN